MKEIYALKFQRNEYGKKIRKGYENGSIKERMRNIRERSIDYSGCSRTITTVAKDFMYVIEVDNDSKRN